MSSGSKFPRGTGRGQFRPPQNRGLVPLRHGPASSKKTSLGQGRDTIGSHGAGNGGTTSAREESFQLLAHPSTMGRPFAMIIRLQPEILEELKQAEADGIQPSMKFGANATGHVIQVGSKSFRFSSAPEPGDLCDIYEQKQGESGEAVLVEAGSAWRKLSVQRILSATEKDRVKKRTAEAEHRQKQRKSILVDPSTQMIIPQAGPTDANGRKPAPKVSKEPPPKKRRVTASPIKQRPQTAAAVVPGNRQFASPASPSFDPPVTSVRGNQMNQMGDSHPSKGRAGSERVVGPSPSIPKEKPRTYAAFAVPETAKSGSATNLTDLRNFLIGLLQESPKGVTIKSIEKAVAEGLSGVADKRALDKVMKSIASFHAPGKYLLNAGVEKGNYLEPGPPTSSGRAQEAVRPTTHEAEPSNGILEKEAAKDKEEPSSYDGGLSSVVSHYDVKEPSPKHTGDSIVNNEDLIKQEASHVAKDPTIGGSDSSSSSGTGSGSDSDSDSTGSGSGSGTDSGSGSGSGSDSDSSSSSSGASMDEDVNITSDDDEKGTLDAKQKLKGRESKPLTKEDIKTHENNLLEEGHDLIRDNPVKSLDQANIPRPDMMTKASDNIIKAVFGTDEQDDFEDDSEGHTRGEHSRQEKASLSQYGERQAPAKAHISRDSKDGYNFEGPQGISTRDNEDLGIEEKLDMLVEKISESNMEVGSLGGNRGGLSSSQQEHHKPLLKSGGPGPGKDNDKRRADTEYRGSHLDRRDRGAYPSSDGRSALKNRSLEVHSLFHEGSPMDTEERLQNIASSERLSQVGAEARKTGPKKSATKETHERFERAKAPEAVVKGRSPSNIARATEGSSNAFEGASKLDDERIGRLSDRGGAETSDYLEIKQRKDKALEENIADATKSGDISGRQSRDFETQHLQQKDVVAPSKGSAHRVSRDSNHLSGTHDRESPHLHKSKITKHSRHKGEPQDRAGLNVELAERPMEESDSARRGKDLYGKGALKEPEPGGRLSSVEPSNVVAKETARFGESGQSHGRNNVREKCRAVSQPAEVREPPFENGTVESKKWLPPMEDSRSKATSSTIHRLPYKGSLSPDQEDLQPLDIRALELPKLSPVRTFDDSRHHAYESRSAKRRPEESESTEMERSKRRAGAGQVKQQPHHKEEWFQGGPVKQNHIEKGRLSASDSQEYAGTSKFSVLENSVRSDEELDEAYRQQRASQTRAASSDLRRDNLKAGDSLDNFKRLSPHSADETEGSEFFAPYEKKKPDLRGLINTFQEYKEYCKEYREKYPVYIKLNGVIELNKKPFESLKKDMERARFKDDEKKLAHTRAKVRREYALRHKKRKRMFHTFRILHEELQAIKTRCKEYAEKVGQG